MVHEKMYQIGDLARMEIGSYLKSLTHHISQMYLTNPLSVTIKIKAKDILLPIDQAIPCALLVNELLSNSLKYAFPKRKPGKIEISMATDGTGYYVLVVADNGIGLPLHIDYKKTKSLGMQLVTTFASQLQGTIELQRKQGTKFTIKFAQSPKQ